MAPAQTQSAAACPISVTLTLRRHALILAVLIFVAPLYFAWTWNGSLGQPGGDGANYLMMAQHYSPHGVRDPVYATAATYSRFPPLYPLVLALADAADDLHWAHAATTACLLLALFAFHAWLRNEGLTTAQSALLVLVFAALPGSWIGGLSIQSEYLYLFFSLLALTLMATYQRGARREILYGAALAVGAAVLTRTVGITLYAPLLLLLLRRAPARTGLLALIIALFPEVAWQLVHRPQLGYSAGLHLIYSSGGWSGLWSQLAAELPALRSGFGDNFLRAPALRPLLDLLGMLCLAGTALRALKLRPDAVYLAAHLAILLVWPYPAEAQRFLWVLVPLLMAQPPLALAESRRESADSSLPRLASAVFAGAMLLMALPALMLAADRRRSAAYSDLPDARGYVSWYGTDPNASERSVGVQVTLINAMRWIPEHVPVSDCVIATRPDLVSYFGHRHSVFPPLNSVPDPYFVAGLRQTGCHYIFGMSATDSRFPAPLHPLHRLGSDLEVLYLGRLNGDGAGRADQIIAALARID